MGRCRRSPSCREMLARVREATGEKVGNVRVPFVLEDREDISRGLAKGLSNKDIAHSIGRDESVVCREIARHGGRDAYRAWRADGAARDPREGTKARKTNRRPRRGGGGTRVLAERRWPARGS